ncbi:MAG: hypothetical protein OXF74_13005 [Rhodobacteraceae bacterium]|nr:hypothetical protein [Paracoccaceae bacterium]
MIKETRFLQLKKAEILKRNKKIDSKLVNAHEGLERQLKRISVEIKPEFKLEPPLGRGRMRLSNRNY